MLDLFVYLHLSLFLKLFSLHEFFFFLLTIYLQVLLVLLTYSHVCSSLVFDSEIFLFLWLLILSWPLLFLSSNLFWNVRLWGYIFYLLCRHVFLALDFSVGTLLCSVLSLFYNYFCCYCCLVTKSCSTLLWPHGP